MFAHDLIPRSAAETTTSRSRPDWVSAMFSKLYYLHFDGFQVFQQFFEVLP